MMEETKKMLYDLEAIRIEFERIYEYTDGMDYLEIITYKKALDKLDDMIFKIRKKTFNHNQTTNANTTNVKRHETSNHIC